MRDAAVGPLAHEWLTDDGRAHVQVLPKGDPNDTAALRTFATAVLAVEPEATGAAVSYLESGRSVVRAFIEAGIGALISIALLLWAALRRITDVLLTLVPLLVAGVVTLELCVILGLPLNFANIIALPLLLGVGVAFKIYYIMAWRAGKTALLQSTLTRAVIFSAMTTATAFGSLWLSNHPGTSSMGKLLALSLLCTLAAAVLFQPVLMGPPRKIEIAAVPRDIRRKSQPAHTVASSQTGLHDLFPRRFLEPKTGLAQPTGVAKIDAATSRRRRLSEPVWIGLLYLGRNSAVPGADIPASRSLSGNGSCGR